jgi:hypothetical protein
VKFPSVRATISNLRMGIAERWMISATLATTVPEGENW